VSGSPDAKLAVMADTDGNPEDEYADDEYADHHAEDLEEPFVSTRIPDDEPEADVLEQRQEVPYDQDEDEPWWDKGEEKDQDEVEYDEGE
jgi:hypothetical protein